MQHHFLWKKERKINRILIRRRVPLIEPQANNYRHPDLRHFGWVVQGLVTCDNYDWVNVSWLVLLQSIIADLSCFLFSFFFIFFFLSHGKISKWKRYHTLNLIINLQVKNTNPVILRPLYLHWDDAFHTYQRFFTHLSSVLGTEIETSLLSTNDMVIGTDEEKALVKALKSSFPDSKLTLCNRHLGENFKWHLKDKVGVNDKNTQKKCWQHFWRTGINFGWHSCGPGTKNFWNWNEVPKFRRSISFGQGNPYHKRIYLRCQKKWQ